MDPHSTRFQRAVRIANFLNKRVVKTSYIKSAVYFIIAVVLLLLFWYWVNSMPKVLS